MSVIIRLQGLPWSASAMNIRHFFSGLSIPAGGVHIIGGEGGDAFIAFSSDDDARMAMKMNMCALNGTPVQLFLSSKSEMQSVIDAARSGSAMTPALSASSTTNTGAAAATGMGSVTGGHQSSVHNMAGGFTGMQGMSQQGMSQSSQYGPVGGGFQNMQQRGDISGAGGMGMSGKNEWQPMPGMMGAGGNDGGGQFNSNQRGMMGGDDNTNRFPGYPENRQQMNMQQGNNFMGSQGHMAQGHMGMQGIGGRQPLGMDPSGQGESMGQGRGRFGDDMRAGNVCSSMNQKMGQFGGVEDRDKTASFMPGQMNMDIDSDPIKQGMGGGMMDLPRNRGMNDQMTRSGFQGAAEGQGGDIMKERLSNQVSSGPPTSGSPGLGLGGSMRSSWVGDNMKEGGTFPDKQPSIDPDKKGEPGDMAQETAFRRDRPNRVNRFAEVPENPSQDPFNQPKRSHELDFERDMRFPHRFHDGPKEQMDNIPPTRGFSERPPGERRGHIGDDGMPSTRYPPDDDQFPEEGRFPMGRGGPNDRRPPPIRYMPDDRPMGDDSRMPHNDRGRFSNDERGFGPNEGGRYPPHGDRFPDHDRRFPPDQRFLGNDRNFPPSNDRPYPGDDRRPPGEGRFMPDDRPGMWQGERQRTDDMLGRRPGENPFPLDDPRHREREQELRREAFERNRHTPGGDWSSNDPMHGGRLDYQGRQGNEDVGGKPFPPDRRGFPGDRHGGPGFREDERDFYAPSGRMEGRPDGGPARWNRGDSGNMDRPEMGGRGPFPPGNQDGSMARPDRGPMPNAPPMDSEGPSDMDQRISHNMYGNRRPGMPPNHGRGEGPAEGEVGDGPHDFDNRAMGPRGRGGGGIMMGDRPPRGRGDPFNRGRPGTMSMARGRGMEMDRHFEEGGPPRQDIDNRTMAGDRFAAGPNQGPPKSDLGPRPGMGKSLLGDGPQEPVPGREPAERNKPNESRNDTSWRDSDSRYSRRDSRDRDRRYDDRRGRDRDERDRYRSRYDRDRERDKDRDRDRDRDRRRSRSRSRNRGSSRDRDRYSRDRSARDNISKPESDSSRSTSTRKPDERPTRFLQIKNMPLTISYRDLRRFFHPLEIPFDGIKLINDKDGNRNGEAFIYFHRLDDAVTAQKKNGERNEGKVVSIIFTTQIEFNKAVDSFVPAVDKREPVSAIPMPPEPRNANVSNKPRFIVQLNNLPQTITRQDINLFFNTVKIDKEGEAAYIEFDNNGVATGNGFVEFKTDVDYRKALTHNGSLLGVSKIIVIPGKAEEADKLKAVQGEMFQRAALRSLNKTSPAQAQKPGLMGIRPNVPIGAPYQQTTTTAKPGSITPSKEESSSHDTVCVHIQGLPLLATPRDIKDFFGDSQIALRGINIAHDSQGKPLGEGFVEFKFVSDFEKALKKDKTSMGRHIVAVKPIGKKEMLDKLENAKQQGATPRSLINTAPPTSLNNQSKPPMPLAQQSPQNNAKPLLIPTSPNTSQAPPQDQTQGSSDSNLASLNNQQNQSIPRPPGPSNNSDIKQPGPSPNPANPGPNPNPANPRGPAPEIGKSQGPVMPLLQTPQPQVTMPGGGKSFPPGVLNSNWYYVRCQNFPPDISIGEIMNFFKTYRPIGESIRLHYSSEGHPTGNAVVGFASGEEATRALQSLNMRVCRHNMVTLHPA